MNKQIIKAAQGAGKLVHQAGAKKAWEDRKNEYMSREFKGNDSRLGPITPEQNQAEYDREKNEFYYNKDKGKLKLIPTDDGEVQDRSGIEDWQLAPQRKSALNMLGIKNKNKYARTIQLAQSQKGNPAQVSAKLRDTYPEVKNEKVEVNWSADGKQVEVHPKPKTTGGRA